MMTVTVSLVISEAVPFTRVKLGMKDLPFTSVKLQVFSTSHAFGEPTETDSDRCHHSV